jgi:hypothetical protein
MRGETVTAVGPNTGTIRMFSALAGGSASAQGMTPAAVVPLAATGPKTLLVGVCATAPEAHTKVAATSTAKSFSRSLQRAEGQPSLSIEVPGRHLRAEVASCAMRKA